MSCDSGLEIQPKEIHIKETYDFIKYFGLSFFKDNLVIEIFHFTWEGGYTLKDRNIALEFGRLPWKIWRCDVRNGNELFHGRDDIFIIFFLVFLYSGLLNLYPSNIHSYYQVNSFSSPFLLTSICFLELGNKSVN